MNNLTDRDHKDSNREHSPLKKSDDAELIDTSDLTFEEQVKKIVNRIQTEGVVKETNNQ